METAIKVAGAPGPGPLTRLAERLAGRQEWWTAAGWSLAAAVLARASSLAASLACARLLPAAEFGQLAVIQSTVGMFAPLAGLGLATTGAKFLAECRDTDPARAGRILGLSLSMAALAGAALTAVLIAAAPWLAARALHAPELQGHIVAASGLLCLGVLEAVMVGALTGLDAYAGLAKAGAWSGALAVPLVAGLTYGYGVRGAIGGLVLSLALSCGWYGWLLGAEARRYGFRVQWSGAAAERHMLLGFSLPAYLSGLLLAPVAWLGNAWLVQRPEGMLDMAFFSAADRYRLLLIFVPLAVSRTAVPALARLRAAGDGAGYARTLRWNLLVATGATLVPALVCVAVAGPLMALFGENFRAGWPVLAVLALSAVPTVLNTQLGAALLSQGRAWERTGVDFVLALALAALAWRAVPAAGAVGLAASIGGAYALACVMLGWLVVRGRRG